MAEEARLEEKLCWEFGVVQQNKNGQPVCGDRILVSREDDRVQIVLSDGLGSGTQANIASTLTASLIAGLTKRGFPLEDCIRSVDAALPVTKKHGLAYATFSLVSTEGRQVRVLQYDSPPAVFLRDGVSLDYPHQERTIREKPIQETVLTMKSGDMLVLFSDGVSEAGRGVTTYAGWDRRQMEDHARHVAANILSAVQALDLFELHDDTSVAVLRLRERLSVDLLIGPSGPRLPEGDAEGITLALEDGQSLSELLSVIRRYSENGMMSLDLAEAEDRISQQLKMLAEEASDIRILVCAASDRGQAGGQRLDQVLALRRCLEDLGKEVTLRIC